MQYWYVDISRPNRFIDESKERNIRQNKIKENHRVVLVIIKKQLTTFISHVAWTGSSQTRKMDFIIYTF